MVRTPILNVGCDGESPDGVVRLAIFFGPVNVSHGNHTPLLHCLKLCERTISEEWTGSRQSFIIA